MAPFGPAPEMVSKLISLSACVSARSSSSRFEAAISSMRPAAASRSSQARKCAIAPVGGAGALDLGGVLAGLGQLAWIGHPYDAGLAALQPAMEPDRRRRA